MINQSRYELPTMIIFFVMNVKHGLSNKKHCNIKLIDAEIEKDKAEGKY